MFTTLLVIYGLVALALIGIILIQNGNSGFGSAVGGASGSVFGASGSGNFLTKLTTILALLFFGLSLVLGNLTTNKEDSKWSDPTISSEIPLDIDPNASKDEIPDN